MAGQQYINYGSFDAWAAQIRSKNDTLIQDLHDIQREIKSSEGGWESNSAVTIREKITGMEKRFQQYYDVVENYAKFIGNTAEAYRQKEAANDANAQKFI